MGAMGEGRENMAEVRWEYTSPYVETPLSFYLRITEGQVSSHCFYD